MKEDWRAFLARRGDAIVAGLIAVGTLALLVATLGDYGMAWDEGFTVEREERLREWFARVADESTAVPAWPPVYSKLETRREYLRRAGRAAETPWSRESLRFYWQFARKEPNGHPPFYALLGLAGWAVSRYALPPLESYRFGPAVLFAMTLGVAYKVMARHFGRASGWMAVLGLLTMPRVFAHAHLASYDVPTLCFWFLAVAAFLRAVEPTSGEGGTRHGHWAWTIAFGVAWGCAMGTKLTGWFLPFPLAAWSLIYRDLRAARTLLLGGVVAALVTYAQIPTWWANPALGVREFLESNLTRHNLLPIPTLFFGRIYLFSLPWYNTIVWTAIVVPIATLALALLGAGRVVAGRLRDRVGTMMLGCWAFFMVLRALPNAPGHDGVRQFLAGFVFLACLSGIGLATIGGWLERAFASHRGARALTVGVLAVAVGAGAWSTWRYHPLQLSYYNALIGGLSGATRAGMEPTYYWEAVTPKVRAWLNEHTEDNDPVAFSFPAVTFEYLHRWGLLRASPLPRLDRPPRWFVVMNRPGHLRHPKPDIAQFLLDHAEPAYVEKVEAAPDVPLIAIYSGEDAFAAGLILKRPKEKRGFPDGRATPGRPAARP